MSARDRSEYLLAQLRAAANPDNVVGMSRYGINTQDTWGVSMPTLRGLAKPVRQLRRSDPDEVHELAALLWASGIHEARILAGLIEVPALVTAQQADDWVAEIDSWDVCDQLCGLWASTGFAYDKVHQWSAAPQTFVKRSGFVLICTLAVHDKVAPDERLIALLALVEREAGDERNFVKKAVNWALRQVGKRSAACHGAAVAVAERIATQPSASARWIAADALRELRRSAVLHRVGLAQG